jgi:frataxin-like iron-binding protein CyaY
MSEFKAYIRNDEIMLEGADDKIELFSQFLDDMDEATDASSCDCRSNDKVRAVVENYFPDYVDEVMELFEDNDGYCNCEIGTNVMSMNSVIRKLGRFMDMQDI